MTQFLKKHNLSFILESSWNQALVFTSLNAVVYLLLSLFVYIINSNSLILISAVSLFFLAGSIISFLLLVRAGGILAPITWFTLGSGIFFGFGNFVGNLHIDPYAQKLFGNSYDYMLKNHIINSSTVLIVIVVASLFSFTKVNLNKTNIWNDNKDVLERILVFLIPIMLVGLIFKFYNMGTQNSLMFAGVIQKLSKLLISTAFLSGVLWIGLNRTNRFFACVFLIMQFSLGVLLLSKYEILVGPLAFAAGLWCRYSSYKLKITSTAALLTLFYFFNPIVSISRANVNYDPNKNTSYERFEIVRQTFSCKYFEKNCLSYPKYTLNEHKINTISTRSWRSWRSWTSANSTTSMNSTISMDSDSYFSYIIFTFIDRLKRLALRFDTATVQGFLAKEYEAGFAGNSLSSFWEVFVPRIIWSDKPNVSRYGQALYALMYNVDDKNINEIGSSVAPTFNAESYWNYGFAGLLSASIIFGLIIGFMNFLWIKAMSGKFICYFLFAMQIALWAMYIESWFAATILGEIVIISSMLALFHFAVKGMDLIFVKKKSMDLAINS